MPARKCKRISCDKQAQFKELCNRHYKMKFGITVSEARARAEAGEDPSAGRNFETTAVAPDGRRYDVTAVGSGHLIKNLNIDNESVAMALNITTRQVVRRRLKAIKQMFGDQLPTSSEHITQMIADALKQYMADDEEESA